MSRKLNFIPQIPNYEWIREQMEYDLKYRLESRQKCTSLGRPLYERINVQVILTQECPYHCPFCMERKNPMCGENKFDQQIESLHKILIEHPLARLTITGGEPGLYPEQVSALIQQYYKHSNGVFVSINTTGYSQTIAHLAHINLSENEYVPDNIALFPDATYQTVLDDDRMTLEHIKEIMDSSVAKSFSFRFLSGTQKHEYPVAIWNDIASDADFRIGTFRVGDFFVYATFDYKGKHGRVTLGDMFQQMHNDYKDAYSNIIIHPDGNVGINWK